jgi:hypothetical protein
MSAQVAYRDLIVAKEEKASISYKLRGEVRDPLFVLASELDERINQSKHLNLWPETSTGLFTTFMMIGFLAFAAIFPLFFHTSTNSVLSDYHAGKFSQDIQGLFKFTADLEAAKAKRDNSIFPIYVPFVLIFGIGAATYGASFFIKSFLYPFNFVWESRLR